MLSRFSPGCSSRADERAACPRGCDAMRGLGQPPPALCVLSRSHSRQKSHLRPRSVCSENNSRGGSRLLLRRMPPILRPRARPPGSPLTANGRAECWGAIQLTFWARNWAQNWARYWDAPLEWVPISRPVSCPVSCPECQLNRPPDFHSQIIFIMVQSHAQVI